VQTYYLEYLCFHDPRDIDADFFCVFVALGITILDTVVPADTVKGGYK